MATRGVLRRRGPGSVLNPPNPEKKLLCHSRGGNPRGEEEEDEEDEEDEEEEEERNVMRRLLDVG